MSGNLSGNLIVISGPSGVGKTTVSSELLRRPHFRRVVTATSRPPRAGERDGVDYRFLSPAEFEAAIARGEFLEHARVHGHLYGTPKASVAEALRSGDWVILNIDVQGARQVRAAAKSDPSLRPRMVFLDPPSSAELERRLRSRASDDEGTIRARLEAARREMEDRPLYDHVILSDEVPRTVERILRAIGYREGGGAEE